MARALPEEPEWNHARNSANGPGSARAMKSAFDVSAPSFELHRSLPAGAPEAIRSAIYTVAGIPPPARVLDIGAGTGRIGRAFVEAGDFYIGVDSSLAMLQEFRSRSPRCILLQGDGSRLPFIECSFDIVLLMQVLSGAEDWMGIVKEAKRTLRRGGCVAVGHTVSSESGIDVQFKRKLISILDQLPVASHRPDESRREALGWLKSSAVRHERCVVLSWQVTTSAKKFLDRHRTGSRFAALPSDVQELALGKLRDWAEVTFGTLDASFPEVRSYELGVFEF